MTFVLKELASGRRRQIARRSGVSVRRRRHLLHRLPSAEALV